MLDVLLVAGGASVVSVDAADGCRRLRTHRPLELSPA